MPRLLARLGVSAASVLATLLLLEAGIRVVRPQDLGYFDSRSFARIAGTTPHYVDNIPDSRAKFIGVPVSINHLGLRGDEINVPKPDHTVRILAVGDSVTFGYGIPAEKTYAKILEKRLNENAADAIRYEVLNGGTLGGSLGDYLHFLNQKAAMLEPDVVVAGITLNDILVYSEAGEISAAGAEWQGRRQPRARKASQFLLRHSQLYMLCYSRLKALLYAWGVLDMNKVQGANYVALAPPAPYQTQAWESSLGMLSRIVSFCRAHGHRLIVVVFPMEMQLSAAEFQFYRAKYRLQIGDAALSGDPQRRLREYAAQTGVTLVDPLPAFRASNSQDLYLRTAMIPSDPTHPSVKGNQIVADEIFHALQAASATAEP